MATGTATTRRLAKIAERLGPTQLLVQWLTAAQEEYPSFSAYAGYVNSTPDPNPKLWMLEQVAGWVRGRISDRRESEVNQETSRLVTATLGCVALVRQINGTLRDGYHSDVIERRHRARSPRGHHTHGGSGHGGRDAGGPVAPAPHPVAS
jgi:hypothetical protein